MSTGIEWTDVTWNPTRGCSRVSPGCEKCYAERQAARFAGAGGPYHGLVRVGPNGPRWTGDVRLVPDSLTAPLHWRKPRRVFVDSMSDLFHEKISNEDIAAVFGVMAASPQHTFQVLTKRAERMLEWFMLVAARRPTVTMEPVAYCLGAMHGVLRRPSAAVAHDGDGRPPWPLPNVWLGVSVEDQQRADERIPPLLATPAAVRFVSYEPALGPVDFQRYIYDGAWMNDPLATRGFTATRLNWIIVGGESGPGAREFDLAWARSIVAQCRAAGVAMFIKQDSGRLPGIQGRFTDEEWAIKEFPNALR